MIDFILVAVAFLWTLFATASDIKTREVPDWLNYSLVAIGIGLRAIYSIASKEWTFLLYGIAGLFAFFLVGNFLYYTRQWGGGDAKLLMGYGVVFGSYPDTLLGYFNPNLNMPFIAIILINILLVGAVCGLVYSVVLAAKNKEKFLKEIKRLGKSKEFIKNGKLVVVVSAAAFIINLFFINANIKIILYLFALFALLFYIIFLFIKSVENIAMYKKVRIEKVTEGDWIANNVVVNGRVVYRPERTGITKRNIMMLKRLKVKNVVVREGIPFVPSFFIALIISLIWGNLFAYVI